MIIEFRGEVAIKVAEAIHCGYVFYEHTESATLEVLTKIPIHVAKELNDYKRRKNVVLSLKAEDGNFDKSTEAPDAVVS